jgi:hypothetical protein
MTTCEGFRFIFPYPKNCHSLKSRQANGQKKLDSSTFAGGMISQ